MARKVTQYRSCRLKARHKDAATAYRIATRIEAQTGAEMHAYRCPFCGAWHVGGETRRRKPESP